MKKLVVAACGLCALLAWVIVLAMQAPAPPAPARDAGPADHRQGPRPDHERTHTEPQTPRPRKSATPAEGGTPPRDAAASIVIRGRVTTEDGDTPPAGARVALHPRGRVDEERGLHGVLATEPLGPAEHETATGADGAFVLVLGGTASADAWIAVARADGFAAASLPAQPGDHLAFELVAARSSRIDVVDVAGTPIAGAEILVYEDELSTPPRERLVTDKEGTATLVHGDRVDVLVRAPGHATHERGVDGDVRITLGPGRALAGLVVDESDAPLRGVRVLLDHPFRPGEQVTTAADGRFHFDGLAPTDEVALEVELEGYPERREYAVAGDGDVRIVLVRPRPISGRVVREDGRPVSGARVRTSGRPEVRSGADGAFVIEGVGGGPVHLLVLADELALPWEERTRIPRLRGMGSFPLDGPDGRTGLEVVVRPQALSFLHLRIVDESGRPIGGVTAPGAAHRVGPTSADGVLRMVWMHPPSTELQVRLIRGVGRQHLPDDSVVVDARTTDDPLATPVDVVMRPRERVTVPLTIVVTGPRGEPLPTGSEPTVRVGPRWLFQEHRRRAARASGVTYDVPPDEPVYVEVKLPGHAHVLRRLEPRADDVTPVRIELAPAARIVGRMLPTGRADVESTVGFRMVAERGRTRWFQPTTWEDGRFGIDALPAVDGKLEYRVGGVLVRTWEIRTEPGEEHDVGDLEPPALVTVRGEIRDRDGDALGGVAVRASDRSGRGDAATSTTVEGTFELTVVPMDGYVHASRTGFGTVVHAVARTDWARPLELRLPREGRVRAVAILPDGLDLGSWHWDVITVDGLAHWQPDAVSPSGGRGADGRPQTTYRGLAPGPIVVRFHGGGRVLRATAQIIEGETVEVEVREPE